MDRVPFIIVMSQNTFIPRTERHLLPWRLFFQTTKGEHLAAMTVPPDPSETTLLYPLVPFEKAWLSLVAINAKQYKRNPPPAAIVTKKNSQDNFSQDSRSADSNNETLTTVPFSQFNRFVALYPDEKHFVGDFYYRDTKPPPQDTKKGVLSNKKFDFVDRSKERHAYHTRPTIIVFKNSYLRMCIMEYL